MEPLQFPTKFRSHSVVEPTGRTDRPSTVFIAPEDLLAKWRERPETPTDLLAFADKDVQHAVDIIRRDQPRVVVFDQMFASTSEGTAVVDDLCSDPRLARTDIRLLEAAHSASLGTYGPTTGPALANLAKTLARRPLRQASRVKMPAGSDILVDGASATLVDISTSGAQVVSSTILKPSQRVRLVVTTNGTAGRSAGRVVWSSLEMVQDRVSCRAGVLFKGAHPEFLASLPPSIED